MQPRNARIDMKVQKGNGARPAGRAGGVFANPLASELADGLSKTPSHSLRERFRFLCMHTFSVYWCDWWFSQNLIFNEGCSD